MKNSRNTPIKVVTSFSEEGYRIYGRAMLESFLDHWPKDVKIYAYYEGSKPALTHKRLKWRSLFGVSGAREVIGALGTFQVARGEIMPGQPRNYRYDAFRFVRKVFAQADAATNFSGTLIWLDADTRFTGNITREWLDSLLGDHFMAYMGRSGWHSCASFVMWNTLHAQNVPFWTQYYNLIVSGRMLLLPEWHDSFWLDAMREGLELDVTNVTPLEEFTKAGPINVFNAVFAGKGQHLKGGLKYGPQRYQQLIDLIGKVQPERVVEIGTWNGNRAMEMFTVAPNMSYVGFDLFEDATPETDASEKNVKPHVSVAAVMHKLTEAGLSARLVKGDTRHTLPAYLQDHPEEKHQADLVYVDGGHSAQTIASDLDAALELVKPGGLIVMDDWYEGMEKDEMARYGCQVVLPGSGLDYTVLPIADPVKGGGVTKMAVINC